MKKPPLKTPIALWQKMLCKSAQTSEVFHHQNTPFTFQNNTKLLLSLSLSVDPWLQKEEKNKLNFVSFKRLKAHFVLSQFTNSKYQSNPKYQP